MPNDVDQGSLFENAEQDHLNAAMPLAAKMRPRDLQEYVGQQQILGEGKLLRRMLAAKRIGSIILHGPPGTGKTTLARLIAKHCDAPMRTLSAVSSGVKEVREVLAWATDRIATGESRPLLFIDEIHRFSKSQQDALLPDVESGIVSLIGATTANPSFAVNGALLSRSQIFELQVLKPGEIATLIHRALSDPERGLGHFSVRLTDDAIAYLAQACEGDARRALTALEIAVTSSHVPEGDNLKDAARTVTRHDVGESIGRRLAGYDATGDDHYDLASALIKSIRGSDVDAGLYWLARMLEGGEDIRFLTRRLIILASEDIGNADPNALCLAVAAMQACEFIGLPEAQLTLSQTVAYLALAPKSNSATRAIGAARSDVKDQSILPVPKMLRDVHYAGAAERGHGQGYVSAHSSEDGVVELDYLGVDREYYQPNQRGVEAGWIERLADLRLRLRGRTE